MDGLSFVAAVEPAAAGEPGHGPLNGPAVAAQSLGGLDSLAGDAGCDATFPEPLPQVAVVVGLVGMEFGRVAA